MCHLNKIPLDYLSFIFKVEKCAVIQSFTFEAFLVLLMLLLLLLFWFYFGLVFSKIFVPPHWKPFSL